MLQVFKAGSALAGFTVITTMSSAKKAVVGHAAVDSSAVLVYYQVFFRLCSDACPPLVSSYMLPASDTVMTGSYLCLVHNQG